MPTNTFTNLSSIKKERIFDALLNEFSHHKLSDAQVARVIKECNIARGSFYKYFYDLNDSYNYTLQRVLKVIHFNVFEKIQQESQNTLTSFYEATVDFVEKISHSKYHDFYEMHVAYNQYNLKNSSFDDHQISPNHLIMIVDGKQITDHKVILVVYKVATNASHNVIRSILLGADKQTELTDLKILFKIINQGLIKEA